MSKGSVYSELKQKGKFSEQKIRKYALDTNKGLEYLHSYSPKIGRLDLKGQKSIGIIHRDLKGKNSV